MYSPQVTVGRDAGAEERERVDGERGDPEGREAEIGRRRRRRAAQKERVRLLYRRALKDTLNWAVHRHLFYQDASDLREKFEANRDVDNPDVIDRLIDDAEAQYRNFQHPDPYIVPWAPGGSKFTRNPPPPKGIEIIYNYGKED